MNKHIILIIMASLLLTGCYDYKELNNIGIVSATEINKINDEYIIHAEVINPQAPDKTSTTQAPFFIYEGKGKSIQEAYRNISLTSSRYLYSNHLQLLIINEKIAKNNITEIIDFYLRNPSFRTEFYILIGKNDNILKTTTPLDIISSTSIKDNIDINAEYQGMTNIVTFNDFANMAINKNIEIILPSIEIINNNKESETNKNTEETTIDTKIKLSGLAIFKDNKLINYLNKQDSINYNFIKNNINSTIINYECEKNKYLVLEVIKNKSTIKFKNQKIYIDLAINSNINEANCNISINDEKNLKKIKKDIETQITNNLYNTINNIKNNYNTDVFGFLDLIYKKDYNYYTKVKDNWYKYSYKNQPITINTKVNIVGKGNILEAQF